MNMLVPDGVVLAIVTSPMMLAKLMVFTKILPIRTSAWSLATTLLDV